MPNVYKLSRHHEDLKDYEKWYSEAEPFSPEKTHYCYLLCEIVKDERHDYWFRQKAAQIVYEHSDARQAIGSIYVSVPHLSFALVYKEGKES